MRLLAVIILVWIAYVVTEKEDVKQAVEATCETALQYGVDCYED